ncbi:MAG: DUF4178 domain-containing protein, partial [Microcystaceae cyanobacterium]
MFWLTIIIIIALSVTLVIMQQQGIILAGKKTEALPSGERHLFNLQLGDIVEYEGRDWVIEGRLTYTEDGATWLEYMLQDSSDIRWLSVEEDDTIEVSFLEPNHTLNVADSPPKQLNFEGETYNLVGSGLADMTKEGTIMRRDTERCQYFDYQGSEGKVLSLEFWGGEIEVSIGEIINPGSLRLLPGDGTRVYDHKG